MEYISNILFWISNGLLLPVVVMLLFFLFKGLIDIISLFSELSSRRQILTQMRESISRLTKENATEIALSIKGKKNIYPYTAADILEHSDNIPYCQRALSDYEVEVDRRLNQGRNLIKFGPMLGLMGTLIPMGPALVGLSTGDIVSMAYNMKVAFATTVVGIVIAIIGIVLLQINRSYYASVYNQLEYMVNLLSDPSSNLLTNPSKNDK